MGKRAPGRAFPFSGVRFRYPRPMKRSLPLLLALALLSCSPSQPAADEPPTDETAATQASTAEGYVENVTRAQKKAREMSEEEGERVKEVDEAMKDQ